MAEKIETTKLDLEALKNWAEDISAEWNGKESGIQEDRAHCAQDIQEKVDELIELLNEMQESGIE